VKAPSNRMSHAHASPRVAISNHVDSMWAWYKTHESTLFYGTVHDYHTTHKYIPVLQYDTVTGLTMTYVDLCYMTSFKRAEHVPRPRDLTSSRSPTTISLATTFAGISCPKIRPWSLVHFPALAPSWLAMMCLLTW
jgi:hypothetical protein